MRLPGLQGSRFNVIRGEGKGEPKAQNDPARRDASSAMICPPKGLRSGERLTTTQVGLVTAASFRT